MTSAVSDDLLADDLLSLGFEASRIRRELNPEAVVGYSTAALLRVGPCSGGCALCRLHGQPGGAEAALDSQQALARARELARLGAGEILVHGEIPGGLDIARQLVQQLASVAPVHGFTTSDVRWLAEGDSPDRAIGELARAGLRSLFGGEWQMANAGVFEAAAHAGLPVHALLVSSDGERFLRDCEALRALQESLAGAIASAVLWSEMPETTAFDYLKAVALARTHVPNVAHLQVAWAAIGLKTAQAALHFGADDLGQACVADRVQSLEGTLVTEEELRRLIRDAGYQPARRAPSFAVYYR